MNKAGDKYLYLLYYNRKLLGGFLSPEEVINAGLNGLWPLHECRVRRIVVGVMQATKFFDFHEFEDKYHWMAENAA